MDKIYILLLTLGIHSTHRGFWYLQYALHLCLENEDYLLSVYKLLYADVSEKFEVSRSSVERCIRTAVSHCYYYGNREYLHEIARYPLTSKPTNSEFIDILYSYLKFTEE